MNIEELNKFTKYAKINSPFIKDDNWKNTKKLSQELPKGKWVVTEKIDGTNIRIILTEQDENGKRKVFVGSRNLILNEKDKNSKIYLDAIKEVNINKLVDYFKDIKQTIVIYGEGYGTGIQKGEIYSYNKNYRVFDIKINEVYQDFNYVQKVSVDCQLNIVPIVSYEEELTYERAIEILKGFKETLIKEGKGGRPEGCVWKFEPVLLNKYGERLIFKVKFKDFNKEII